VILLAVRCCLRHGLSYQNLEQLLADADREDEPDDARFVQQAAPHLHSPVTLLVHPQMSVVNCAAGPNQLWSVSSSEHLMGAQGGQEGRLVDDATAERQ